MKCCDWINNARDKVTIQQQVLVADNYGSSTNTWTDLATVSAWVMPVSTYESVESQQLRAQTTHKMLIRYTSTFADVKIVGSYRLKLDTRIHNIRGIKLLDETGKNYGKAFIEIKTDENAEELA